MLSNSILQIVVTMILASVFLYIGESYDIQLEERKILHLNSSTYSELSVHINPSKYRYVLVQAVSQQENVSLSYKNKLQYGNHVNSSTPGLIYMLKDKENILNSYIASVQTNTASQVLVVPFSPKDPIPGGCCITCAFDFDPNLYVKKKYLTVEIIFGRANVLFDAGKAPDICDGGSFSSFAQLEYDLYYYQLRENDLGEESLFEATWRMSSPSNIKRYGKKVATVARSQRTNFVVQLIPYQGVVYNVLVRDKNMKTEACYTPTFVYGCDVKDKSTCKSFGSITSIVFATLCGLVGLGICFMGHKFVAIELLFGGILSGFLITYILLLRFASITYLAHMLASTAAGFAIGVLIVALYLETNLFHLVFLNNSLVIGFLVACSILFSPVGDLKPFSSNAVFLLTFVSIMLACPIPLIFFPKAISILFSSLVGGYAVAVACSVFLHAKIQYIVVEFVLRAGIPSFADAYLRVPFDTNEYILCGVWGLLLVAGIACQLSITRGDQFPPVWKRVKRKNGRFSWFRQRFGRRDDSPDERTHLLQNEASGQLYGTETVMTPRNQSSGANLVL